MKRLIFTAFAPLFVLLSIFLSPARLTASADALYGTFAYVPTDQVYFYSDEPDEQKRKGLFLLPKTYYVRIVSTEQTYYRVEYLTDGSSTQKLVGYCKKNEVTPVDYTPQLPYLYLVINVTYTLTDATGKNDSFSTITIPCAYYGDYEDGTELYCYVLRDGEFGYVPKPKDLTFAPNDEYADRHKPQPSDPQETPSNESKSSLSPAQIAMLVLLCLLIPAVAALIVRPGKKQPYDGE